MASFTDRMIGAAKLEVKTYEEIEHDESALGQAMAVVALSVIASGIGSAGLGGLRGIIGALIAALIGWFVWAGVIYIVGTQALAEPQTKGFTPTQEEVDEAQQVLERYRELEVSGETWADINGKIIDRYEAGRARKLLDWAVLCAHRDQEKAEAVARVEQAGE